MKKTKINVYILLIALVILALVFPVSAADTSLRGQSYYNGNQIDEREIGPGLPPLIWQTNANLPDLTETSQQIINSAAVPALDWSYGCSATSASMYFGYFDRNGYPNMYTGPTNGGVFPLTNVVWGPGECPLSASHKGIDGRTIKGHVDDYWYGYGSSIDPYYGSWGEHSPQDSVGDFMGTSQNYHWQNIDGGTTFFFSTDGTPLNDYTGSEGTTSPRRDGAHGMKLFAVSRGYSVASDYNQYIYGYNGNTLGFTFNQYKAEIDAGYPVLIQLSGHTMLGVGYSGTDQLIVHDTWDYANHTMTWGGTYAGMQHFGVTVFHLSPNPTSPPSITVTAPNGGETWQRGTTQTIKWSYTGSPGSAVKIVLLKGTTEAGTIIGSTSIGSGGTGSYNWPMSAAAGMTTGSDFKVSVQSLSQSTIKDTSDNNFTITSATTPTITVMSPNGGETWQRGTTKTITWSYTGSPGSTVKIVLLKAGTEVGTISTSSSTSTGSYSWPMSTTGLTGSDFTVSVQSLSQPTIKDTSNNNFTITSATSPTITVISPNGGETWNRGTTKTITWSYTGSPGLTVKIVLLKAGAEVGTIIPSTSSGSGGTGFYTWPIASSGTTGSDFTVSVQSTSLSTVKDTSNNNFTITSAATQPPAAITVTAPNGGETWNRGTTKTITWSYTGSPGSTVKIVLLKAGAEVGTIIPSTSIGNDGKGSYTWPIASSGTTGSDFTVSVQSTSLPAVKDASDTIFTLNPKN